MRLKCHSEHLQHSLHTHLSTHSLARTHAPIPSHSLSFRLHVCISFTRFCYSSLLLLRCASTHIFSSCFRSLISKRIVFHTKDLSFSSPFVSGEIVALSIKHGIKCNKYTLPFCIANSVLYLPFSLAPCASVYVCCSENWKMARFLATLLPQNVLFILISVDSVFFFSLSTCFICSYVYFFLCVVVALLENVAIRSHSHEFTVIY